MASNTHAQDKITGPWLWMIAPTEPGRGGAASIDIDSLAVASDGAVTEADVVANGANEGDRVGNFQWTLGEIAVTGSDNINDCLNRIGMTAGNVDDHSAYALFTFESDTVRRNVTMVVGSDDAIKVWLNGEVVHKYAVNRPARDFQDIFQVDLKKDDNLLLVKVSERAGNWTMFVGVEQVESRADPQNPNIIADVNDDGVVNIQDLVLVAGELGTDTAAPSAWHRTSGNVPSRTTVEQWLTQAYQLSLTDVRPQRGVFLLERLLAALTPKETALLTNYPNPFNPETWGPYQLAKPVDVTLHIYSVKGALVRTLTLGH